MDCLFRALMHWFCYARLKSINTSELTGR